MAFISLVYLQDHFRVKVSMYKNAIHNTDLGVLYTSNHELPYGSKVLFELDENLNDETSVSKSNWGIFDIIRVKSIIKDESFEKIALMGGYQTNRNALYLEDTKRPLVVVGNTEVVGNTLLPKNGVKRGSIAGHSYTGSSLIYGNIGKSTSSLPKINNIDFIKRFSNDFMMSDSVEFIDLFENQNLINSFKQATKIHSSYDIIDLNFVNLTGNIIVQSDTLIRVQNTSKLKDIILIAPTIELSDQVNGNFQAIASKNILIGKECYLSYPSAFILVEESTTQSNNKNKNEVNQILIDSNSRIKGSVCYISNNKSNNHMAQIILDKNSLVIGEIYCSKNIELKGSVSGMVSTRGFIANQFGSIYQNHIYNGKIIEEDLHPRFVGLTFENTVKRVAKWLY